MVTWDAETGTLLSLQGEAITEDDYLVNKNLLFVCREKF